MVESAINPKFETENIWIIFAESKLHMNYVDPIDGKTI